MSVELLYVEATRSTPVVRFDPEKARLVIVGESYPENAAKFYGPLFEWLEQFLSTKPQQDREVVLDMELAYFNSSTSKILLNLFDRLDMAAAAGWRVTVNWLYRSENDVSKECGEEFLEEVKHMTFQLVQKP
jgi:hypothetical protein